MSKTVAHNNGDRAHGAPVKARENRHYLADP